ncbi:MULTISPECIES: (2Fe-2S)-binding protein [unclassified Mycobacterium]|uniref:(2Fe-2S)-binding protein n=1 Tax=unclassified Mycobacterium TaxID=2642494 RepID=UPI0029C6F0DB|nr:MULTISPECIES: (2Fe-2S)-binding protein [unclassified Mycobacterium]
MALTAAADIGPYFALHGDPAAVTLSHRRLCEPQRLHSLLSAIGERIGTREGRVAASTLQYGLAARYWSLVLGAWRFGELVIDLRGLGYVHTAPDSVELTLTDVRAWDCTSFAADEVAELIVDTVAAQLTNLHTALRTVTRIADGLLWGNAASALVTAAHTVDVRRPSGELTAVTTAIRSHPLLSDRMVTTSTGGVRRRSCCLWYRTLDRTNCGDCPLTGRRAG